MNSFWKGLIKYFLFCAIFVIAIVSFWDIFDDKNFQSSTLETGKYIWTYNTESQGWTKYSKYDKVDPYKIILKYGISEEEPNYTYYNVISQENLNKKYLYLGENSVEFIKNKNLYSYYPKAFKYYQIIFNGVEFISKELSSDELKQLFNNPEILKISDIIKGNYVADYSKKTYILINDIGEKYNKYYITPSDSKKLQIGYFSNQFRITSPLEIKLQRLDGCSDNFPCYEFKIGK